MTRAIPTYTNIASILFACRATIVYPQIFFNYPDNFATRIA